MEERKGMRTGRDTKIHRNPICGFVSKNSTSFTSCSNIMEKICSELNCEFLTDETRGLGVCSDGSFKEENVEFWHTGTVSKELQKSISSFLQSFGNKVEFLAPPPQTSFVMLAENDGKFQLITDVHGTIPCYYAVLDDCIWFSSELRLVAECVPDLSVADFSVTESMFRYATLPPRSLFNQVSYLGGSSVASIDRENMSVEIQKYFNFNSLIDANFYRNYKKETPSNLEEKLLEKLQLSVARAISGYDTAGIFLSGGVDSSLLVALAVENINVQAVHVELPGESNEIEFAKLVADSLSLELQIVKCDQKSFIKYLVDTVFFMERPFFIPNSVGLVQAAGSKMFSQSQIIVDGELADSPFYSSGVDKNVLRKEHLNVNLFFPESVILGVEKILNSVDRYFGRRVVTDMDFSGVNNQIFARRISDRWLLKESYNHMDHIPSRFERELAAQTIYAQSVSCQSLITRVDAAARACGLHSVLPYADLDYLKFVLNLPSNHKIKRDGALGLISNPKWMLKKVAAKKVPSSAIWRKKIGFGLPVQEYVKNFPVDLIEDSFFRSYFKLTNEEFGIYLQYLKGRPDFWFVVCFEIWGRLFVRREDKVWLSSVVENQCA